MAFEAAKAYLSAKGFADRIQEFTVSSATVDLAAQALGTEPARIAKSLTFLGKDGPVMVVCAGDCKVSSSKFKAFFGVKAKMLTAQEVHDLIGHDVGGVCPFGVKEGVEIFLDVSLQQFDTVYPACGSSNSAVCLSPQELAQLCGDARWADVCRTPEAV